MTDLVLPDQQTSPGVDLELWARKATSAAVYAEAVCSTSMVPAAYRGKPAEATAAILAGAELGFSPMASLRAFDNIQGVPAPKAMTLRAVVQAAGHEVVIEESSSERAVVSGRRKGSETWQTSVWDLARAQGLAQFKTNVMYRTNLAQMLAARATAEVCRWIAADAVMGMPYSAEEIGDHPELQPSPIAPIAHRLTMAELDAPAIGSGPAAEPRTEAQKRRMFKLWADLGFGTPDKRDDRLARTAKILGLDSIGSSDDLTAEMAGIVIARLEARLAEVEGQTGGTDA